MRTETDIVKEWEDEIGHERKRTTRGAIGFLLILVILVPNMVAGYYLRILGIVEEDFVSYTVYVLVFSIYSMCLVAATAYLIDLRLKLTLSFLLEPKTGTKAEPRGPNDALKDWEKEWIALLRSRGEALRKRYGMFTTLAGLIPPSFAGILIPRLEVLGMLIAFLLLFIVLFFSVVWYLLLIVQKRRFLSAFVELILKGDLKIAWKHSENLS